MTKELKEQILEMTRPYPLVNDNTDKQTGYHQAMEEFIRVFDILIEQTQK